MIIDDIIGTIAAVCEMVFLMVGGGGKDKKVSFIDRIFMGVVIIGIIAAVVCFDEGLIWWLPRQRQKGSIYRSNSHISRPKQYYCKIYAYIGWKKLYRDRPIT